jgi:sec-independent protein translocase protein TatA
LSGERPPVEEAMGLSAQHILLLLIIALLLFGRGKISELMGDVAKGIKSFKKGMAEDEDVAKSVPPPTIDNDAAKNDRSKTG